MEYHKELLCKKISFFEAKDSPKALLCFCLFFNVIFKFIPFANCFVRYFIRIAWWNIFQWKIHTDSIDFFLHQPVFYSRLNDEFFNRKLLFFKQICYFRFAINIVVVEIKWKSFIAVTKPATKTILLCWTWMLKQRTILFFTKTYFFTLWIES